jgi:hypothetical protein
MRNATACAGRTTTTTQGVISHSLFTSSPRAHNRASAQLSSHILNLKDSQQLWHCTLNPSHQLKLAAQSLAAVDTAKAPAWLSFHTTHATSGQTLLHSPAACSFPILSHHLSPHLSRALVSLNWSPPKLLTQGLMPPEPSAVRYMKAQNTLRVVSRPAGGVCPLTGLMAGMMLTSVIPSIP